MTVLSKNLVGIISLAALLITGCKADISRNADGSFDVETTIGQQELQEVITASIADPLIKDVTVSLQSGYVLVSGTRARLNDGSKTDTLSFRLDLGARNGLLTSSISNAQLDGIAIEQDRVDRWNEKIVNRLARLSQKNRNSTLTSIIVTPQAVTLIWNVSK